MEHEPQLVIEINSESKATPAKKPVIPVFTFEVEEADPENKEQEIFELPKPDLDENGERILKVRIDKWLWATRFYKTRELARLAVQNGYVSYNGQKTKPSREIQIGATLTILQGKHEKTVKITGLSTRRRNSDEAHALYEEHSEDVYEQPNIENNSNNSIDYERNYNTENANSEDNLSKPKKVVRFLRRAFVRDEATADTEVFTD